ncbi:MAG: hypothetical protein KDJ88_12505 [Bauldia sp.]|nr:hypothetical protein [Bauldia sp.]
MNDFYSVLTQSIIDRGLRSARDREATYSQARTAMIRRLWSYDPPLTEDEIDARIGQFDLAVDEIESNVVEIFERMPDPEDEPQASAPPPPPPPVVGGYDQATDYAPAFDPGPAETDAYDDGIDGADGYSHPEEPVRPPPPRYEREERNPRERSSLVDLLSTLDVRSMAVEAALNADPDEPEEEPPPAVEPPQDEPPQDEPVMETRALLPVPMNDRRELASYSHSYEEEAVLVEPPPRRAARPAPRPRAPAPQHRPPPPVKTRKRVKPQRQTKPPPREQAPRRAAEPRARQKAPIAGRQLAILIGVVGVLAVALIAVTAYILLPGRSDQPAVATTPATPAVAASSPAGDLPPLTNGTIHRFVLFDGSDPTLFDSDPSNPVRFDGSTARIATSPASAGARAMIGPGLAARLGGHTVNVIVVARIAKENGAANLRFALQSGLAVSYWKTARLTSDFAPISLTWRVPTLRTDPTGDTIIIEPGIPGDGTGTEIKAIVVDVLD